MQLCFNLHIILSLESIVLFPDFAAQGSRI